MISTLLALVLILLHLLACAVLWALIKAGILDVGGHLLAVMVLIPVFGPLCTVAIAAEGALWGNNLKPETLERLKVDDEVHRNVSAAPAEASREAVPLEEALIVNDPDQRRRLMLSVLTENPEDYLALLQAASLNDDTEVAHYAASAVAQLSKEADLRLQRLEQAFKADPSDAQALDAYCDYLSEYLQSGLAEGQAEQIQRRQLLGLLKRRLDREGGREVSLACARAMLDVGEIEEAGSLISQLIGSWPADQDVWMLALRCAVLMGDGARVKAVADAIADRHVYLNARNRERLEFWTEEEEVRDGQGTA